MAVKQPAKPKARAGDVFSELYYPQGDLAFEEFCHERMNMYADLLGPSVDNDIVCAVHDGRQHAGVSWVTASGERPQNSEQVVMAVIAPPPRSSLDEELIDPEPLPREDFTSTFPETTGEALAFYLSAELDIIRKSKDAPVRRGNHIARATIAWIADDLLGGCRKRPPGYYLKELITKLLDVDREKKGQSKQFAARTQAAWILAQAPDLESEELAVALKVDRSSISRWRREGNFVRRVSYLQTRIEKLKRSGQWSRFKKNNPAHPSVAYEFGS